MTINVAVLGAGRWGVHLVRNFLENPQTNLVAVVDPNLDRLQALRSRHQLNDNVILATEWEKIRQLPGLEAVVIATPASTHYTLVTDALQQGYNVLAEKPLTLDPTECVRLCRLAEQQQRQLVIDHTYLFHPAVERGKEIVRKGILGDLRYGYAARTHLGPVRSDVDALWDLAIHDICIFNSWLSQTPTKVQASGTVWLQTAAENSAVSDSPVAIPQGLADLVWVNLTYPNGFQVFIHLCWLNNDKQRRLVVAGSEGSLIFDELSKESPLTIEHGTFELINNRFNPINQNREVVAIESAEPLKQVCQHFINCITQNHPSNISSGWVGAQLVQILSGLTESLKQGGVPINISQILN
ncbi:MAG TPA: Gfo/Idh/MocA family oxidoreductase [Leptolyngbyaceae cyanobacterium]